MKFITYQQYIEYLRNNKNLKLKEKDVTYQIYPLEENEIYHPKRIETIDKKHDKMFRHILSRKKEMIHFLNEFLALKQSIKPEQLMQCHTDFITKQYKEKHCDLIYQLKQKPVYFLVEHQSTIDQDMPLRIWEYVGQIMRKESIVQRTYLRKDKVYPVVVPIVIYTGFQKWKVKTNFAQSQYPSPNYEDYKINLEYNLIAVQDYTLEELLEKRTLFASIMIIEKCRGIEELNQQINKIVEVIDDPKDLEALAEIITNIIVFRIGQEKAKQLLEKIRRKGELGMSPVTKMLFDLEYKNWKKGLREGIKKGKEEGIKEGIKDGKIKTIKNMIQSGESEEKIIKYTEISKEELRQIKRRWIASC